VRSALLALIALAASIPGAALAQSASFDAARVPGAWASGDGASACQTAAISYFMSDGTYVVFEKFDGPLHAVGRWRLDGDRLIMTHNDAPFPEDGAAGAEAALTVKRLDVEQFVTTNAAGRERIRTRCRGLTLPPGAKAGQGH
jgi:hypothetical protein